MKINKGVLVILIFIFSGRLAFSQHNYIVEIDRINDKKIFKELQFIKGNPIEKITSIPTVENGDIITVRMINFNEIIYGFEVKTNFKLVKKSALSKVINNAAPILELASTNGSISFLQKLTSNPPSSIDAINTRDLGDEKNVSSEYNKLLKIVNKVAETQVRYIDLINNESILLDSLKESVLNLSVNSYIEMPGLVQDLKIIKETFNEIEENNSSDDYKKLKFYLEHYDSSEIIETASTINQLNKLLSKIDFVQERTFVVEGKTENSEVFYLNAIVYKRGYPLKESRDLLPYYNFEENKINGDQIRQNFRVDFMVKHKNRLYFNFSINQIFIPQNRFAFRIIESLDSFKFSRNSLGRSSKTSFGMNLNYDLPNIIPSIILSSSIGYSMVFNNTQNGLLDATSVKKGFLMSGLGFRPTTFPFLSLSLGCAWAKYDYLSPNYVIDKKYSNSDVSLENRNLALTNKIKPAFFAGININL